MLKSYLRLALRSLRKQKAYAAVNGAGLALGVACCLLIGLYVQHERSYDRFHTHADRIVRVVTDRAMGAERTARTAGPVAPMLDAELPGAEQVVRLLPFSFFAARGDVRQEENAVFFADSTVLSVFSFALERGNPATALREPFSLVLTAETARRYFGDGDPMGQTLRINDAVDVPVTGVLRDVPANSHLQFDFLVSMATARALPGTSWMFSNWRTDAFYTYLMLEEGARPERVAADLAGVVSRRANPGLLADQPDYALALEPLTSIYLGSDRAEQAGPVGNRGALRLFGLVGALILLIAGINYTNLATARAATRAKEVGVRKAVGARREQLAAQFLAESVLMAVVAVALGAALAQAALPAVSAWSGKPLGGGSVAGYALVLAGLALGLGLAAGSYPAVVLSRFRPTAVLKGRGGARQGQGLRQALVAAQFSGSVALIAATFVASAQVEHLRSRPLGFDAEAMLILKLEGVDDRASRVEAIKSALAVHPAVRSVAASGSTPAGESVGEWLMTVEGGRGGTRDVAVPVLPVDADFLSHYGVELVAGRALPQGTTGEAGTGFIINEAAVDYFGYASPEEALGKQITNVYPSASPIVGVAADFHYRSLHEPVGPLVMRVLPGQLGTLSVQLRTDDLPATLADLEALWGALVPSRPFAYRFLDSVLQAQYQAEERLAHLFGLFGSLAILTACLGLLGLTAYAVQRRTKEIGIRKVLGAGVPRLVALLSADVVWPVGVAFVVGGSIAFFALRSWLDAFATRVDLGPAAFVAAGGLVLGLALLTVGALTARAARANPIEALRYE